MFWHILALTSRLLVNGLERNFSWRGTVIVDETQEKGNATEKEYSHEI